MIEIYKAIKNIGVIRILFKQYFNYTYILMFLHLINFEQVIHD